MKRRNRRTCSLFAMREGREREKDLFRCMSEGKQEAVFSVSSQNRKEACKPASQDILSCCMLCICCVCVFLDSRDCSERRVSYLRHKFLCPLLSLSSSHSQSRPVSHDFQRLQSLISSLQHTMVHYSQQKGNSKQWKESAQNLISSQKSTNLLSVRVRRRFIHPSPRHPLLHLFRLRVRHHSID